MYKTMRDLLRAGEYTVVESFELSARSARFAPIPSFLDGTPIGSLLREQYPQGVWSHQALALEALGRGTNVVVATGTASGKSLIFRTLSAYRIVEEPDARILVFYPLKALAADQLRGWREAAHMLGLPADTVGRIDGSVAAQQRDTILESARVVLMTPDVCHAWLMSRLATPTVKNFLRSLRVVILDEAHTLEGVFGSNFAFLARRLMAARARLQANSKVITPLQYVAATATISNPIEHLKALTGQDFDLVGELEDGSPRFERLCVHVGTPPEEEIKIARDLQSTLIRNQGVGGFITFLDSRKGVELLARGSQSEIDTLTGESDVMPYRAGYDAGDREAIERRLQTGTLRGVVTTSALELGIDLPHLAVGLNVGVPATRKSYRQRLGRVGRSGPGAFVVVGVPTAFTAYGTSYRKYHELSVEPSYLYLNNRFMQFAHARCLVDELEALGGGSTLPARIPWPDGFAEAFMAAKPGGHRAPEFDAIAQLGGDSPQRNYPLRNVGEINFKVARGEQADAFGDASEAQALRECYPGATYFHMARAWEVVSWHTNAFVPFIKVKPSTPSRQTRPRIRTWINAGITAQDLMEGHLLVGESGFIAECQMQITEKVEGYTDVATGQYHSYADLRQRNPNLRPRMRNFRTSGVIVCIDTPWFRAAGVKQTVADGLTAVFSREYSVLPQDVGSAATNISVRDGDGGGLRGDCIAVFDQTYGSLRLTENLYLQFETLLERLRIAFAAENGGGAKDKQAIIEQLYEVYKGFSPAGAGALVQPPVGGDGLRQCFVPGSIVCYREKGKFATDVEVIQPTIMQGQLMYQIKTQPAYPGQAPMKNWVAADYLEPSGDGGTWEYGWWNSQTEEYEDPTSEGEGMLS